MGLDAFVHRISKPALSTEELSKYSYGQLRDDYVVLLKNNLPPNFDAIRHMSVEANVAMECVDMDRIREEYHVPNEFEMCGWGIHGLSSSYSFGDPTGKIDGIMRFEISDTDMESKFLKTEQVDVFCFKQDIVRYWRNNHELSDAMTDASDVTMENCGYYPLNDEMWDVLQEMDPEGYSMAKQYCDSEDCMIVYYEWY